MFHEYAKSLSSAGQVCVKFVSSVSIACQLNVKYVSSVPRVCQLCQVRLKCVECVSNL